MRGSAAACGSARIKTSTKEVAVRGLAASVSTVLLMACGQPTSSPSVPVEDVSTPVASEAAASGDRCANDGQRLVNANGVEICTEAFGDPADPPMLLIPGASASMMWWDDDFCRQLAAGGRYVIRLDNRDSGESVTYPVGEPPYTLADMAQDAVGVLDAYEIDRAHVVGRSMGGMITQHMALDHPERLRTITLIYSSPEGGADQRGDLPGPAESLQGLTLEIPQNDPDAALAARVELQRVVSGSRYPFDAENAHALIAREIARARHYASSGNHTVALQNSPGWRDRLSEIEVPTLVVHGTEDPLLQFPHGEALANEIPGATMLVMEGVGHELPEGEWDRLIATLLEHTAERAEDRH